MNAAGVQTSAISIGSPIKQQTTLTPGKARRTEEGGGGGIRWSDIAKAFRAGDVGARQQLLATHLTNPNSTRFLTNLAARSSTLDEYPRDRASPWARQRWTSGREQCWAPSRCGLPHRASR